MSTHVTPNQEHRWSSEIFQFARVPWGSESTLSRNFNNRNPITFKNISIKNIPKKTRLRKGCWYVLPSELRDNEERDWRVMTKNIKQEYWNPVWFHRQPISGSAIQNLQIFFLINKYRNKIKKIANFTESSARREGRGWWLNNNKGLSLFAKFIAQHPNHQKMNFQESTTREILFFLLIF